MQHIHETPMLLLSSLFQGSRVGCWNKLPCAEADCESRASAQCQCSASAASLLVSARSSCDEVLLDWPLRGSSARPCSLRLRLLLAVAMVCVGSPARLASKRLQCQAMRCSLVLESCHCLRVLSDRRAQVLRFECRIDSLQSDSATHRLRP